MDVAVPFTEIAHCSGYYTPDGQWTNGFSCGAKQFCCVQVSEKLCCNLADRDSCCSGRPNANANVPKLQSSAPTRRLAVSTSRLANNISQEAKTYALQRDFPLLSSSTKTPYDPQRLANATARPLMWTTPVFPEFVVIGLAVGSILLVLLCSIMITVYGAWRKRKLEIVNNCSSGAFRFRGAHAASTRVNGSSIPLATPRQRQPSLQQAAQSAAECYVMGVLPPPENFRTIATATATAEYSWNPQACATRQLVDQALARRMQEETDATEYANISSIGPSDPYPSALQLRGTNTFDSDNLTEVSSITFNSDVIVWVPPAKKLRKVETCIV